MYISFVYVLQLYYNARGKKQTTENLINGYIPNKIFGTETFQSSALYSGYERFN